MVTHRIRTPDGSVHKVRAPRGASEEELFSFVQQQTGYTPEVKPQDEEGEYNYKSEDTTWYRDVGDVATGLASGAYRAAGAAVSLGSLVEGLHEYADPAAKWLNDAANTIDEGLLSDRQKEINQELSDRLAASVAELGPDASIAAHLDNMVAQGGEAGAFIADHPGQTINMIAQSIPYIVGGGYITKGIRGAAGLLGAKKVADMGRVTGAAIGEGAIIAGETTKNIIEKTDSVGDYSTDRLAAVPAGLGTTAISMATGRMANKSGVADIDVAITDKIAGNSTDIMKGLSKKDAVVKGVKGAGIEGLEETGQGFQEKVWENVGTGEHPLADTGGETVLGTVTGATQGGAVNLASGLGQNRKAKKIDEALDNVIETVTQEQEAAKAEQAKRDADNEEVLNETLRLVEGSRLNVEIEGANSEEAAQLPPLERALYYLNHIQDDPNNEFTSKDGRLSTDVANIKNALEHAVQVYNPEVFNSYINDLKLKARNKHAKTFPNEKDWIKANREEVLKQQRAEVNDPNTELGKMFLAWKNDPDVSVTGMHDTDENGNPTDEAFKAFLKDNIVPTKQAEEHAAYVAALDAHAAEQEANPTPIVEETAEDTDDPYGYKFRAQQKGVTEAEWLAANLESMSKESAETQEKYKDDIAKKQQRLAELQGEAETETETDENVEAFPSNPFIGTKKKVRKASWDKAAEALGENFESENDGLSQLIHDDKRYSSKGFDKALADVVKSKEETNELSPTTEEVTEGITTDVAVVGEAPTPVDAVVNALTGTDVNWNPSGRSKNRPKLVRWFAEKLQDGTIGDFIDKDGNFINNKIVKDAGLKKSDDVTYNKNTIRDILTEVFKSQGYESVESFIKAHKDYLGEKYRSTNTELANTSTPMDDTVSQEDEGVDVVNPRKQLEGEVDQSSTVTAGGSKGKIFALSKEEESWVDQQASESEQQSNEALELYRREGEALRAKNASAAEWEAFNQRLNDLVVKHPDLKQRVIGELKLSSRMASVINNKAEQKIASDLWDMHNEGDVSYNDLSEGAKYDWHLSIDEYAHTKNVAQLKEDVKEILSNTYVPLLGGNNAQTKQKLPTKSEKATKRLGKSSTGSQRSGSAAVENNGKDTPKPKPKKYTKKQQEAIAYAEKHIGRDWETSRKRLVPLLKKQDLKDFYDFVDKVAGVDTKANVTKAKEKFETKAEAEKTSKITTPKKAKLNKTEARKYARKVLGRYWKRDNPELVDMVTSKEFNALDFQRKINEIVDAQPEGNKPQFAFRDGVQRSKDSPHKVTREDIEDFVAELMGRDKVTPRDMRRIHIFQSHQELSDAIVDGNLLGPSVAKEEIESITKTGSPIHGKGVAFVRGVNGVKHAFFILDEMDMVSDKMGVAGIFAHEVGVHMGMQSLMGGKSTAKLASTIRSWAARNDGSVEQKVALEVEDRIAFIQEMNEARGEALMDQAAIDAETVAYAVQFGIENHGINPLSSKPVPKGSLRSLIKSVYNTLEKFMKSLTGGNAKSITVENLVDAAYGAARLEINKTYHVSTTEKIGDVDLTRAGSGLDGAVNGFGFNITDRFGSAGVYANEISRRNTKVVTLGSIVDGEVLSRIEEISPDLARKLKALKAEGAYLLSTGKKWKPAWGMFTFTYHPGTESSQSVVITPRKNKFGDSGYDLALDLRDQNGARMFTDEEVSIVGAAVSTLSGAPQVYTHMVDVLVTDEELMSLDDRISEQKMVVDFVNSMSKELQALIESENDEGATLEEMSGRALYETLVLIEAGHTKKGAKGYQLINELADTHKVTHDDLKVANQIEGEMRHSAKIAAIMDKAGVKGTKTVDLTEPGGSPSEVDALSDKSLSTRLNRKLRVAQGVVADAEGRSRDSKVLEGTYNKVIFNEDNIIVSGVIKMADSGGKLIDIPLSKKKDYISFSIKNERNHKDKRNIRKFIKSVLGDHAAYQWDTLAAIAKKGAEKIDFLSNLVHKHRKELPAAVDLEKSLRAKDVTRNDIIRSVESIAVQTREMAFDRRVIVNQFIEKATVEQIWPDDPNIEGREVTVDKDFHKEFTEVLSEAEQKVVMDVFRHGHTMATTLKALAKELGIDSEFLGFTQLEGPYAPLMRFGDYIVEFKSQELRDMEAELSKGTMPPYKEKLAKRKLEKYKKDRKHYEISMHPNKGQAVKYRDANQERYDVPGEVSEKSKSVSEGRVPDVKVLEKVYGAMNVLDLDPNAKNAFKSMLDDMYHAALEESNARHSQTKRKGYAGYNSNMLFAFVEHAKAEANMVATLKHGKDINVTLAEVHQQAKDSDNKEVMALYNNLVDHYTHSLAKSETPYANAILSTNAFWLLTTSPGYHIQNATQTVAVAHPILAGVFGDWNNVRRNIMDGYRVANKIVSYDGKVPMLSNKKVTWQTEIDIESAPEEYRALLSQLQGMGQLDVGVEEDLSSIKETDTGFKAFDTSSRVASKVSHRAYQVPRMVESYNRVSTAIAAFNLAKENPQVVERMGLNPTEFAIKMVQDTQGDFSATGAPELFKLLSKHGLGKVVLQFRKFSVMMMWAYARATKKAFKGATKEEKQVGRRTLAYLLGHTFVLSGLRGLPALGKMTAVYLLLASALGDDDNEEDPKDTKGYVERMVDEHVDNKTLATMINRGVLSAFGVDASLKLSHEGVFDLAPFAEFDPSIEGIQKYFYSLLGPTGGNVANIARGVDFAKNDNYYRALESVSPKGLKTVMESWRLGTEGYTDRVGRVLSDPKNFDLGPLIANALGIPVNQVTHLKWTIGEQYEIREHFTKRQSEIKRAYIRAYDRDDRVEMNELIESWRKLQDSKDKVRPFFNDDRKSIPRSAVRNLTKGPRNRNKTERKYRRPLGTD